MRVIAIRLGFYGGHRVRIGQEFDLPDATLNQDKEGRPVLPKWVLEATPANRAQFTDGRKAEVQKAKEAAIAAAGPKRAQRGFVAVESAEDLV